MPDPMRIPRSGRRRRPISPGRWKRAAPAAGWWKRGGEAVACGTLALFVRPPYPGNLAGREGYVLNMYTLPAWRRRGMANALLVAIKAYAREQQLGRLWLHASDEGRSLYERFGFADNPACLECVPAR